MDVLFRQWAFPVFTRERKRFKFSGRENLFLSAFRCWDDRLYSSELHQKFIFGRVTGCVHSCMESLFYHSKRIRLHALLHDAAGAVRWHSYKGPHYWYKNGREPNSCQLGYATRLHFCFSVKLFLQSTFVFFDFWSFLSCISKAFQLADTTVIIQLGVFSWEHSGMYILSVIALETDKKINFCCTKKCKQFCGTVDFWITMDFPTFFPEMLEVHIVPKGTKICQIVGFLLDKILETLDEPGCLKSKTLLTLQQMKNCDVARVIHSDTKPKFFARVQESFTW